MKTELFSSLSKFKQNKTFMLQDLLDNYGIFGDALVTDIHYHNGYDFFNNTFGHQTLKISISCFNKNRNYDQELITIYCDEVSRFIYEKWDGMIYEALLKEENGEFILDFAHESSHPYFIVKCKKITYEVIAQK
ncbi:hypothetical protein [Flavobacterium sp. KACC 22763]|uniref:hypothetical protein n=1 Tax=Flavobacterium sp. KACC 22763 TaxID=3025668 RepID=UPI002366DF38|nr:hypothetical protein [Flavobacterium sp. KACC 22763]WDF65046.1 hypothetical protein PQ463_02580 [Flavobacterium sp. KACC 22763]